MTSSDRTPHEAAVRHAVGYPECQPGFGASDAPTPQAGSTGVTIRTEGGMVEDENARSCVPHARRVVFLASPAEKKVAMKKPLRNPPPSELEARGRAFWTAIVASYDLDDHGLALLRLAAVALDQHEAARLALVEAGSPITTDRFGQAKPHPAVGIMRDCAVTFARLTRELNLADEAVEAARPPVLKYGGR